MRRREQLHGLWLECSLDPSRMGPEEALRIALDLIGPRIGVTFFEPDAAPSAAGGTPHHL